MKRELENALISGRVVKTNTFATDRGEYKVDIITYKKNLYFFKYKDGKLVECLNISKM